MAGVEITGCWMARREHDGEASGNCGAGGPGWFSAEDLLRERIDGRLGQ
jgi:hypothetical protein